MEVLLGTRNYMITLSESIKKENVKQKVRIQGIWWLYIKKFYKESLQYLTYNAKKGCIVHLILVGISSRLIHSVKVLLTNNFRTY